MDGVIKTQLWEIYQDIGRSCACEEMTKPQLKEFVESLRCATVMLENELKDEVVEMPLTEVPSIEYRGCIHVLVDETVIEAMDKTNKLYRVISNGIPTPEGPFIDFTCVVDVIISADSYQAAIEEFHATYRIQPNAHYMVELIGSDLRASMADPGLTYK